MAGCGPNGGSVKTEASDDGLLVIDFASDGRPIGIEITDPHAVTLDRLNAELHRLRESPLPDAEFQPLRVA